MGLVGSAIGNAIGAAAAVGSKTYLEDMQEQRQENLARFTSQLSEDRAVAAEERANATEQTRYERAKGDKETGLINSATNKPYSRSELDALTPEERGGAKTALASEVEEKTALKDKYDKAFYDPKTQMLLTKDEAANTPGAVNIAGTELQSKLAKSAQDIEESKAKSELYSGKGLSGGGDATSRAELAAISREKIAADKLAQGYSNQYDKGVKFAASLEPGAEQDAAYAVLNDLAPKAGRASFAPKQVVVTPAYSGRTIGVYDWGAKKAVTKTVWEPEKQEQPEGAKNVTGKMTDLTLDDASALKANLVAAKNWPAVKAVEQQVAAQIKKGASSYSVDLTDFPGSQTKAATQPTGSSFDKYYSSASKAKRTGAESSY